jgi:hypothetical protein
MSIKTLKKRIAVVAVSALTAGVLSVASTPVANAAVADPITKADIFLLAPASAGSAGAIGQCAIAASAQLADAQTVGTTNSTGTVLAVGAVITFDTATNGSGNLSVTGPAKFALGGSVTTGTISQNAKSVGFSDASNNVATLEVTGAGDIVVTAKNSLTIGEGSSVKTFSITGVDSCSAGDTPVVANSFFSLRNDPDEEGSTVDETMAAADLAYGETQYIAVELKNAYKADLTAPGILTAEGTGAVLIGMNANGTTNLGFATEDADDASNFDIFVAQNKVLAPGAPLTTTVTIKFNGVTMATKTLTFHGVATSIVVDEVTVGTAGGSLGKYRFLVKDAAGNNLDTGVGTTPAHGSISAAIAGYTTTAASFVSDAAGTVASSGSTKATGTFTCVAAGTGKSGANTITLGAQIGTTLVKSNEFSARCGDSEVRTFTASMDKAVYSPGEIATLTLSALDRNAATVGDSAVVGAAFDQISIPGMTIIGSAISSADVFTNGSKTYKFRVDQAEGAFVGQAQVTVGSSASSAEKVAKTVQYSIKASGTTVTNAEVLKSIVALIASINKQIQALQKLILKR